MDKTSSHLIDKIKEILMKRYAVEKILTLGKIIEVTAYAFISFLIFQAFWIITSCHIEDISLRILSGAGAIFLLLFSWRRAWKIIGKVIPKFVLIGMLGWIFIIVNITPNLIIGDDWGEPKKEEPVEKSGNASFDKNGSGRENITYSISLPVSRLFNLSEKEIELSEKDFSSEFQRYIGIFISPYTIINKAVGRDFGKNIEQNLFFIFVAALMFIIIFIDMLLTVSTYKNKRKCDKYLGFYSIDSIQREKDVSRKLVLFSIVLLILTLLTKNYFILFWLLSFMATVFMFKWEIQERGQNHKPLTRSVLFVLLTHVFSLISGAILFLLSFPLYTILGKGIKIFNLYDSIVIGWTIILGSSVTVLIGIVTQVIWSGKRMTEKMKS